LPGQWGSARSRIAFSALGAGIRPNGQCSCLYSNCVAFCPASGGQRDPELPFPHLDCGDSPQRAVQLPLQQLRGVLPGQWGSARSRIAFSALGSREFAPMGRAVAFTATAWRFARPVGVSAIPNCFFRTWFAGIRPNRLCSCLYSNCVAFCPASGGSARSRIAISALGLRGFVPMGRAVAFTATAHLLSRRHDHKARPSPCNRSVSDRRHSPSAISDAARSKERAGRHGRHKRRAAFAVPSRSARAAPSVRFTFWIASNTREKT